MGLTVYFAGYSKTVNSTAHPSTDNASAWSARYGPDLGNDAVFLKGSSTVVNPVIIWNHGAESPTGWNYCWIRDFSRFYFIKDWKFISNGNWEMSLEVDVMATYRNQIGNSNHYIVRSNVDTDGNLVDDVISPGCDVVVERGSFSTGWENPFWRWSAMGDEVSLGGNYVIKTLAPWGQSQYSSDGPYQLYKLSQRDFNDFVNAISNGNVYSYATGELIDSFLDVVKSWSINPLDYIISCKFIPFHITHNTQVRLVTFGNFYVKANGYLIPASPVEKSTRIDIPKHPQASAYGGFLNITASKYELYIPVFGKIELNQALLKDSEYISIVFTYSPYNGDCICEILNEQGLEIDRLKANIAVEIPLQSFYTSPSQFLTAGISAISAIGGAVTGNPIAAAIGTVSAVNAVKPVSERIGSGNGDFSDYDKRFSLIATFFRMPQRNNYHIGAPCGQVFKPIDKWDPNVQGRESLFLQCSKVKIKLPASSYEIERVKSIMEEGFYFE